MKSVGVIGAGFSGLASACMLAKDGYQVTVFEKNDTPGGRARKFLADGFTFDMGPSWYWMPDVFEQFFNTFNKKAEDYYNLIRLDPSYRIYYGKNDLMDLPAGEENLCDLFENLETGSGDKLKAFLKEGKYKYEIGINDLVHKPGLSIKELIDLKLLTGVFRLHVFQSISSYIRKFFTNKRLIQLLEFPVLFLGSTPEKTPALYSLMNYADMSLGTWYPDGGMHKIIEGMESLAKSLGVKFKYNCSVNKLELNATKVKGIWSSEEFFSQDYVVGSADYHHIEQQLLPEKFRKYDKQYWDKRTMAPSSLLFYLGINKKIKGLLHHTLFFDEDFALHAHEIYEKPKWPTAPQFYVSCPSKTDDTVAPEGCENLLILIPVAAGLCDDDKTREKYFDIIIERLEHILGESIRAHILFKKSYAHNDCESDYNAYRGNAYGLANTLNQTANLRPTITSKKLSNLFYTGQLTVPGPGVPPAIISGQVVARELISRDKKNNSN
jgi:phytoene desaturase